VVTARRTGKGKECVEHEQDRELKKEPCTDWLSQLDDVPSLKVATPRPLPLLSSFLHIPLALLATVPKKHRNGAICRPGEGGDGAGLCSVRILVEKEGGGRGGRW
jgi:hypothetical protein